MGAFATLGFICQRHLVAPGGEDRHDLDRKPDLG